MGQQEMQLDSVRDVATVPPSGEPVQQELGLRMRGRGMQPEALPPGGNIGPQQPDDSPQPYYEPVDLAGPASTEGFKVRKRLDKDQRAASRQVEALGAQQNQLAADEAARRKWAPPTVPTGAQMDLDEQVMGPDQPSAEPMVDLAAQLQELADPASPRQGVYLSRDNLSVTRLNTLPDVGVPLPNFDGRGGSPTRCAVMISATLSAS